MRYLKLFLFLCMGKLTLAQTEMELQPFKKIVVTGAVKVVLVKADKPSISSIGSLSDFKINIQNGVLSIGLLNPLLKNPNPIVLHFTHLLMVEAKDFSCVGNGIGSNLAMDTLVLKSSDAAYFDLNLEVGQLILNAKDASKIKLIGKVDSASIDLFDASKLYASGLEIRQIGINASASSYFNVNVSQGIDVNATDAARGVFVGSPINKKFNVNGLARIVDAETGEKMQDERAGAMDTMRISVGKKKLIIIEEGNGVELSADNDSLEKVKELNDTKKYKLRKTYAGIEFGFNQFVSPSLKAIPNDYAYLKCNTLKSWFISYNLLEGDVHLIRNKIALTSGLGIMFQNMRFNTNRLLVPNTSVIAADAGLVSVSNNNLFNTQFNVPLLLKYAPRTKNLRNKFNMAIGVIGTFNIYTHLRVVSSAKGYTEDLQIKDDFNINPFGAMGTLRISYSWLHMFTNYSLTPYFRTQNQAPYNPDLRLFSFGLAIIPRR